MVNFQVADLVPHAGQMMLIDKVISYDQQSLTAETTVRADGLFDNGLKVPAWIGVEYMAQTIAAFNGTKKKLCGQPISVGFLLGTRRYDCNSAEFSVGSLLTIKVSLLVEDKGLSVFDCELTCENIHAVAKLNVYEPDPKTIE